MCRQTRGAGRAAGDDPGLRACLADAPILATQACFRPVTQDGLPLLGPVPGVTNAYVATGHSVWGILNAPASGEAMAELILEGSDGARRPATVRSRALACRLSPESWVLGSPRLRSAWQRETN